MRLHARINERTVHCTVCEQKSGRSGRTVIDRDLPAFDVKILKYGTRTFFVRMARKLGAKIIVVGMADEVIAILRWYISIPERKTIC